MKKFFFALFLMVGCDLDEVGLDVLDGGTRPDVFRPELARADVSKIDVLGASDGGVSPDVSRPEDSRSDAASSDVLLSEAGGVDVVPADAGRADAVRVDVVKPASSTCSIPKPSIDTSSWGSPSGVSTTPRQGYQTVSGTVTCSEQAVRHPRPRDCSRPENGFSDGKLVWCCVSTRKTSSGQREVAEPVVCFGPGDVLVGSIGRTADCSPEGVFLGWDCAFGT